MHTKINAYKKNLSPKRIFETIISNLNRYKDTSFKKDDRLNALRESKQLLEYIISVYEPSGDDIIVVIGLNKIVVKMTKCLMFQDKVHEVNDEIGFLKILSDSL
jgi:hypothetical protein